MKSVNNYQQGNSTIKRTIKIFSISFIAMLFFNNSFSQEKQVLNLKDAVNYALLANQDVRKAKLDVENANYKIDEVKSRALPQINGSGALSYNPILQKSALPGEIFGQPGTTTLVAFGQKWNANVGVAFNQAIFDRSVLTGLKAARTTKEFYQLNSQLTDEQVIEMVATNYYRVLVQRQQFNQLDSTINYSLKIKKILSGLYENGLAKKIDVDRISVSISNLQSQRQQLINGVSLLENNLKFSMGMPIETELEIPEADLSSLDPELLLNTATPDFSKRTERLVLESQLKLLNFQKEAYRSEYYPSLALSSSYSYQGLSNNFPVFKGQKGGANWFDVASVGLTLKVPLFNGFATRSRVNQADVSIRKLNEDIAMSELGLNLQFENAKTQINNNLITLKSQKENVELAKEVFDNSQNNYNNGLATLTDLLDAENALTQAQNSYSSALLEIKLAEIQLIKSQGNLKSIIK